jgi:hypothetical protein
MKMGSIQAMKPYSNLVTFIFSLDTKRYFVANFNGSDRARNWLQFNMGIGYPSQCSCILNWKALFPFANP